MRRAESLRFGPSIKDCATLPHRVRSIECVILSFRTSQKVELDEARNLFEVTVAGEPDRLEVRFGPLCNTETIHGDKHWTNPLLDELACDTTRPAKSRTPRVQRS